MFGKQEEVFFVSPFITVLYYSLKATRVGDVPKCVQVNAAALISAGDLVEPH